MAEEKKSWEQVLAGYAKAFVTEAVMPAAEKMIPQGASELAQALNTGSGFVAYGPTNAPVGPGAEIEAGGVHGLQSTQAEQQPSDSGRAAEVQTQTESSYEASLAMYVARAQQSQQTQENVR